MEHIGGLNHLQELTLIKVGWIDDVGMEQLAKLSHLQQLTVESTALSESGLRHLSRLPRLASLSLKMSQISDAGLEHVGRMENLESLTLDGTRITDAGLQHLAGHKRLSWLSLEGTPTTGRGLAAQCVPCTEGALSFRREYFRCRRAAVESTIAQLQHHFPRMAGAANPITITLRVDDDPRRPFDGLTAGPSTVLGI